MPCTAQVSRRVATAQDLARRQGGKLTTLVLRDNKFDLRAHDSMPQSAPASNADTAVPRGAASAAASLSCRKERPRSPRAGSAYAGSMESSMRLPQGS